jgi:hypothetical protein
LGLFNNTINFSINSNKTCSFLEIKRFSNCYFSLSPTDRFPLLMKLLDYEFLTKEVIENLKDESINRNVNISVINSFLAIAKRRGVLKFE